MTKKLECNIFARTESDTPTATCSLLLISLADHESSSMTSLANRLNPHRDVIHPMHARRKATSTSIQAPNPTQAPLARHRKRATMAVNALDIVAIVSLLTGSLAGDDPEDLEIGFAELMVVRMRTLVCLAGVVVAAAVADVVLVAGLELLDALYFVAVVLEDVVYALSGAVATDG